MHPLQLEKHFQIAKVGPETSQCYEQLDEEINYERSVKIVSKLNST